MTFVRNLKAGLLAAGVMIALPAGAWAQSPTLLFSYEALTFDALGLDGDKATYDDRATFTTQVKDTELPQILTLLNIPADSVETQVTPGGYLLETNASLQSSFETDEKTADLFASAVGFTFRQWSVLVTDFTPAGEGNTGYGVITFADHVPTGDEAQDFFEHAAEVDPGLQGGYTAFGRDLYFLNVTDGDGKPYSGIDDAQFIASLQKAAESYTATPVTMSSSGRVDARFVENDWEGSPEGQDYAATLGPDLTEKLTALREAHETALKAAADQYGWK